jgi:hypothetical protein
MAKKKRVYSAEQLAMRAMEDECVKRQNAGLPPCGKCGVCADDFFFRAICDEVDPPAEPPSKH